MTITYAQSPRSGEARQLVTDLQARFVDRLEALNRSAGHPPAFARIDWLRDEGRHGGGHRLAAADAPLFNRASVNVSQVHYDDLPDKALASATALSTIIHPANPHGPSVHMHISWTEMRDGKGYWRVMADLNPSIAASADRETFRATLSEAAPAVFTYAEQQGDRYFTIPALDRTRGVAHFYLERYATADHDADRSLAQTVGERTIDTYARLLGDALAANPEPNEEDRARQLEYHTVYFFQVLTLDRGTTSGLLVHDQNDVGILGSLPSHVDRSLLTSFEKKMAPPQDELLRGLIEALAPERRVLIDEATKRRLAQVVRAHYRRHPEALALQAAGDIIPPTVANHATAKKVHDER